MIAHDAGRILNPMLVEGQIYGATVHGIGGAFFEEFKYDADGQLLTGSLMDYLCPTATEPPRLVIDHLETPSPVTLLGAKGVGEGNCMSTPPVLANAVADALRPERLEQGPPRRPPARGALVCADARESVPKDLSRGLYLGWAVMPQNPL